MSFQTAAHALHFVKSNFELEGKHHEGDVASRGLEAWRFLKQLKQNSARVALEPGEDAPRRGGGALGMGSGWHEKKIDYKDKEKNRFILLLSS